MKSIIPRQESRQLDIILNQWCKEAAAAGYSKERIKGTAFERLCKAFLTHDPMQKTQYEPPVRYGEWARARGLPETDLA